MLMVWLKQEFDAHTCVRDCQLHQSWSHMRATLISDVVLPYIELGHYLHRVESREANN